MMGEIADRILGFLNENLPGSRIDDGYYFVAIRGGATASIRHGHRQRVADRLCERPFLLTAVGLDPRPLIRATDVEELSVEYNPDWDVHVPRPQWLAEVPAQQVDVRTLVAAGTAPGALAFIDPERRVIVDLYLGTVHAPTRADLEAFVTGLEDSIELGQ